MKLVHDYTSEYESLEQYYGGLTDELDTDLMEDLEALEEYDNEREGL